LKVKSACKAFHTYQLLWTHDRIVMGVDGRVGFRRHRQRGADWPFDHPFYLILNLAIGGTLGGARGIDNKAFPASVEVDFVRVYAPAK
jgi:beta-glucanase (GH16 family)